MAEIFDWSVIAGNNNNAPPDGFPEGMIPSALNNAAREVMAVIARHYQIDSGSLATTGASNAYILTVDQVIAAYADGLSFTFRANHTNTGDVTLNINALGATPVLTNDGEQVPAGQFRANGIYRVTYSDSAFRAQNTSIVRTPTIPNTIRITYNPAGNPDRSSHTYTKPANLWYIDLILTGAGGGGAAAFGNARGGSGAGGETIRVRIPASLIGVTETILIGKAGIGGVYGAVTSVDAEHGFTSSFGSLITAGAGGAAGVGVTIKNTPGSSQGGGVNAIDAALTSLAFIYPGGGGMGGHSSPDIGDSSGLSTDIGALGGYTYWGPGLAAIGDGLLAGSATLNIGTSQAYGTGGSGSYDQGPANGGLSGANGWVGQHGVCLIEEYFLP